MADWTEPTTSTVYTDVLSILKGRDDNAATMFSEALSAATNVPTEAIKWSSSNTRFERWSGAAWLELSTSYDINVTSLGGVGLSGLLRNNPGSDQTITSGKLVLNINSATPLDLKGGTADFIQLQFFADAAAQSTRSAYLGYASLGSQILVLQNEYTNSNLNLITNGSGVVLANGNEVVTLVGGQTILGDLTATTFVGALTGNADTATSADIVTTAAQSNITSLGTLTILTVDNIRINGNTISSIAGTDLFITPLAGQQLILDSNIIIDGGVLTGASSITSTALVSTGSTTVSGELILNAGFSEDADSYTVTTGTKTLNTAAATLFYPTGAMTAVAYTFAFSNPATSGRVTSFTIELNSAGTASSITWPTSVDWSEATEPAWSTSGIDIVSFITRDGGTTWLGFLGGTAFA